MSLPLGAMSKTVKVGQALPHRRYPPAPLADEGDAAAGHPAGLKIVPGAVRKLHQVLAVDVDLKEVVAPNANDGSWSLASRTYCLIRV